MCYIEFNNSLNGVTENLENMSIDTKIDFLSQFLMKVSGIYHTSKAAILFLLINSFPTR